MPAAAVMRGGTAPRDGTARRGGSFAIRPTAARPAIWSLAWTGAVALVGAVAGHGVAPALLLALAVVVGLPHGATDLEVGRSAFRAHRRNWWLPFLLAYLGLVGMTLLAWAVVPVVMLAGFLLLSAFHFGEQDAGSTDRIAILAHGGTVIVVPSVVHPGAVNDVFAILVGERAPALTELIALPVAALWLASVALLAARTIRDRRWRPLVDLLLVAALFAAAPPLVAFSLYFALLHTPRALVDQRARAGRSVSPARIVGLTALACLLGAAIFVAARDLTIEAATVRTSFLLLSALTVPHMALEHLGRMVPGQAASD